MMAVPCSAPSHCRQASPRVWLLLWLWSCLPLLAADLHPREMPRNPSSAKECAICHYRWVDTFFVDARGTELVPLQTEKVEGRSEMCFSCHDGSVLDSRWAFEKERGHPSGVPPRPGMVVPANFPLDEKGNMQCVTCHSAHGVSTGPGQTTSTFLRVNNTNSAICLLCHTTMAGNAAGDNHPMGTVTNNVPPELREKHVPAETAGHLITCETCHIPHGDHEERLLKLSVSDSMICLTCHRDKNYVNPDGSRNLYHVINVVPTNATIPGLLMTNGARLAKNGALTCLTCHKIHQNQIEKHLLVAKVDNQSSFCLNCHTNQQGLILSQHNLALKFPDARNLDGKTVAESGPCSACHLPHKNALALAGGGEVISGLCLSCHGPAGISAKTNLLGRSHPVGISLSNAQATAKITMPTTLPLFNSWRHPATNGNLTCITCHDPHRRPIEGAPLVSAKFLRGPVASLCQECHSQQAWVSNSKHDLSVVAPTLNNIQGQSPTQSGACSSCHLVHSATDSTWAQPWLLTANPAEKCLGCHRADGAAPKKLLQGHSHPIDVTPPVISSQTTLPVYFDSSHTNGLGKLTCITCHDPHRWDPSSVATAGAQEDGTARNSFLRLAAAPAPTLCAACHPNETRVIRTEHDLAFFSPNITNLLGQTAAATGPCGACHLMHQAPIQAKLWAKDLQRTAPNMPVADMMCRSCHNPQGVASSKVPMFSYHPPVMVVHLPSSAGYDLTFFPLFDPISGKQVNGGTIACSSCHNVHQWTVRDSSLAPGRNLEGDSNNSFLRHSSAELPCKVCHGRDSIYRYQYYHKSVTHQSPDGAGLDELLR
jgi:predicted CXXCH cytochrome family protein